MDKSYNVVKEMLQDRGYTIVKESNHTSEYYHRIIFTFGDKKGVVWWVIEPKNGIGNIIYFTRLAELNKYDKFILIIRGSITTQAKNDFNNNIRYIYDAEYFFLNNLQTNITKHKYVPKFEKINDQKESVLKKYNVDALKFPTMLESDPVSLYFNFKDGDFIKVTRNYDFKSQTKIDDLELEICYRVVIKD